MVSLILEVRAAAAASSRRCGVREFFCVVLADTENIDAEAIRQLDLVEQIGNGI
ncbi:hypothetical protein [Mesorhizobium sp. DCY119]|uniref:hypothetical protein n=1 Tax=Mesorhizobium sp. DCY119 TaxID=2108445 RepID=UPI001FE0DF65|nr:hypothetical protein [Mesorhizobium sp. DCY119]